MSLQPFWWGWSSWIVELLTGAGLQLALRFWGPGHPWFLYGIVGLGLSVIYEWALDRHGWSWPDVRERLVGQLLVEIPWCLSYL